MHLYGYYVLNLDPTILSFNATRYETPKWLYPRALIQHLPWWHGTMRSMLRQKIRQLKYERAGINHSLMVNAWDEESQRKRFRIKGCLVSQNIYINQNTFRPRLREKLFDAIYIAQLKPFKRHYLARDVTRLLIMAADLSELQRVQPTVPNATFNEAEMSKEEVADAINASICSLALSEVEGGMLASFESLLCGVPVVSTPSKGGRDMFFNDYNSRIVDPTAKDVASAVSYFGRFPHDPSLIRSTALSDIEGHKRRFCEYVSEIAVAVGGADVDPDRRYERYFGGSGGLSDFFIWADKFERPEDVERIRAISFRG